MARKKRVLSPDQPILYPDHKLPKSRRDFLRAGFITSSATVMMPSILSLMVRNAHAALPGIDLVNDCGITPGLGGRAGVPFICFDLGGGANMTGSNVLVGGQGGQLDLLSTAGYNKLGLPGDMTPANPTFVDSSLGLRFHADSAFLKGIISKTTADTRSRVNGCVIPARSDNDTANNPHNPMYGIAKAGAKGGLMALTGTQNTDSGGRSMAPATMVDLTIRPTKVSNRNDARGLIDTGSVSSLMPDQEEAARIMDAVEKISLAKIDSRISGNPTQDAVPPTPLPGNSQTNVQELADCAYLKTADTVRKFDGPNSADPEKDDYIMFVDSAIDSGRNSGRVGITSQPNPATTPSVAQNTADVITNSITATESIFTSDEMSSGTFQSTAAVMKLVIEGLAGAGTISLGGYDYHNGTRSTGEVRDFRAGQAIGACLEYAKRMQQELMVYVFTDGSLASNGRIDNSPEGRGKGEWTGDNSGTSAAFFLVYSPNAQPSLLNEGGISIENRQQLGYFRSSASVETDRTTPGANAPNLLAEMCVLNYMALHSPSFFGGLEAHEKFAQLFPNHGLGDLASLRKWMAFSPIS